MAQILQPKQTFGGALGTGIGSGLSLLAQKKLDQYIERQFANDFLSQLGLGQPKESQQESQPLTQAINQDDIGSLLSLMSQQAAPGAQERLSQFAAESPVRIAPEGYKDGPSLIEPKEPLRPSLISPQKRSSDDLVGTIKKMVSQGYPAPRNRAEAEGLFKIAQEKMAEDKKLRSDERRFIFKETAEDRKKILDDYRSARQSLRDLEEMEELNSSGKLNEAGTVEFLKRAGLDIPALLSPESQDFEKMAANFIRNAKSYFGNRVTNLDLEQFLKTIPSLMQSPEGRQRIISNLKHLERGRIETYKAYRDILKENDNELPFDYQEQIEDRLDPVLNKLAKLLKQEKNRKVPEGESPYVTAAKAAAGSILGSAGGLVKKAAPALIGNAIGGPTTGYLASLLG